MLQSACPSPQQLAAIGAGRVSGLDLESFEQHLEGCPSCQTALNNLAAGNDTLIDELRRGVADRFADETACHDVVAKIAAIGGQETKDATREDTGFKPRGEALRTPGIDTPVMLGKYEMLEEIGHGGMGTVYRARHTVLKKIVAVKVLPPDKLKSPEAVARFCREIEAIGRLEHPHIVRASDADHADGQHFLVMEWLPGQDLAKLVRDNGPLPVEQACDYIRQAALGLDYAHQNGLVHRDVKPSNLLHTTGIDGKAAIKVLDLGLALLRDDSPTSDVTSFGQIMGTFDYIAPEQTLEAHTVDARADIYSLGCTFYFLLTGRAPFAGKSEMQKLMAHQKETPEPLARGGIPTDLAAFVDKMLAKDPACRPQSMAEVASTLRPTQDDCNNTMALMPRPAAAPAPQRRRPMLIAATLALGLFAAVALTMAIIRISTPEGDYVIDTDDPDFVFSVSKGTVILKDRKTKRKYNLKVVRHDKSKGEFELEATDVEAGLAFKMKTFTIRRDERVALRAWFERRPAQAAQGGPVDDLWIKMVQSLPPEKQVDAVSAKLTELNPGFDGKIRRDFDKKGLIKSASFVTDHVKDISPLRALTALTWVHCSGRENGKVKGQLVDLSPLKDLKLSSLQFTDNHVSDLSVLKDMTTLKSLNCGWNTISDLSPLKNLKLDNLNIGYTQISSLEPLRDMKLQTLDCIATQVGDLGPLKEMPLTKLLCSESMVSDLSPLEGMKLTYLDCIATKVSDLTPVKDMPLKGLVCDTKLAVRHADMLRSMTSLERINHKSATDFWKEVDERLAPWPDLKAPVVLDITTKLGEKARVKVKSAKHPNVTLDYVFKLSPPNCMKLILELDNGVNLCIPLNVVKQVASKDKKQVVTLIDGTTYAGAIQTTVTAEDGKTHELNGVSAMTVAGAKDASPPAARQPLGKLSIPKPLDRTFDVYRPLIGVESGVKYGESFKITVDGESVQGNLSAFARVTMAARDPRMKWNLTVQLPAGSVKTGALHTPHDWWYVQAEMPNGCAIVLNNHDRSAGFTIAKPAPVKKSQEEPAVGEIRAYLGHTAAVSSVAFAPDGKSFLSGGDAEIFHWDVASAREKRQFADAKKPLRTARNRDFIARIAYTKDGKQAVTGGDDQVVRIWDVGKGEVIKYVDVPKANPPVTQHVTLSADDRLLLVGPAPAVLRLLAFPSLEEGNERYSGSQGHFSKDGNKLLTLDRGYLQVFHLNPPRRVFVNVGDTNQCALTPDGRYALAGGLDSIVYVWDMVERKVVHKMAGHKGTIQALAVSPDGKRALSGGGDNMLRLWDLTTGKELRAFEGHTAPVNAVAFSPDGRMALSAGSTDKSVRLWQLPEPMK